MDGAQARIGISRHIDVRHAGHRIDPGLEIDPGGLGMLVALGACTGSDAQKAAEYAPRIEARAVGLDLPDAVRPQRALNPQAAYRVEGEIREEILDGPVVGTERHPAIDA